MEISVQLPPFELVSDWLKAMVLTAAERRQCRTLTGTRSPLSGSSWISGSPVSLSPFTGSLHYRQSMTARQESAYSKI
jgi:hypothetical protein